MFLSRFPLGQLSQPQRDRPGTRRKRRPIHPEQQRAREEALQGLPRPCRPRQQEHKHEDHGARPSEGDHSHKHQVRGGVHQIPILHAPSPKRSPKTTPMTRRSTQKKHTSHTVVVKKIFPPPTS